MRVTIEIPAEILADLDATAEEIFASRSAALRLHWKRYRQLLSDSTSNMTADITFDAVAHGTARYRTVAHTPDPAPARDHHTNQPTNQPEEESREQRISELLRTLPWYGARLPRDDTPERRAAALVDAYPGLDLAAELAKASNWLHDNPKRRKRHLGSFLSRWLNGVGRAPNGKKYRRATAQGDLIDGYSKEDWLKGCDNV